MKLNRADNEFSSAKLWRNKEHFHRPALAHVFMLFLFLDSPRFSSPYSLLCHVDHGLWSGVTGGGEVVAVSLHADGLQPVLHRAHG